MAKGVKTGGRTKGVRNKRTAAVIEKMASSGMLPHEFLCAVSQGRCIDGHDPSFAERMTAAAQAAPFYAAKLAAVEVTGKEGGPIETRAVPPDLSALSDDELARLYRESVQAPR